MTTREIIVLLARNITSTRLPSNHVNHHHPFYVTFHLKWVQHSMVCLPSTFGFPDHLPETGWEREGVILIKCKILKHCVVPENIHTPTTEDFLICTPLPPGFSVPGGL